MDPIAPCILSPYPDSASLSSLAQREAAAVRFCGTARLSVSFTASIAMSEEQVSPEGGAE